MWVTVVALQILLNDTYKLNHCKEMGAEPGRRFLIQPAVKLEPVVVAYICVPAGLHAIPTAVVR